MGTWRILAVADSAHACNMREGHFRIALWLTQCRGSVTAQQVMDRYPGISRATAYRIINDWKGAQGIAA